MFIYAKSQGKSHFWFSSETFYTELLIKYAGLDAFSHAGFLGV